MKDKARLFPNDRKKNYEFLKLKKMTIVAVSQILKLDLLGLILKKV